MERAKETWLITGGAGYIGSHVIDEFLNNGKSVVVFDSFSNGLLSRIEFLEKVHGVSIPVVRGDIRHLAELDQVFEKYNFDGIIFNILTLIRGIFGFL